MRCRQHLRPDFGQKFSTPEFVITGFETAFKAADRESRTAGPDEGVKVQTSAHGWRIHVRRAWRRPEAMKSATRPCDQPYRRCSRRCNRQRRRGHRDAFRMAPALLQE